MKQYSETTWVRLESSVPELMRAIHSSLLVMCLADSKVPVRSEFSYKPDERRMAGETYHFAVTVKLFAK